VSNSYHISLIDKVREQMAYLQNHNNRFRTEIEADYQAFLDYIDSKSEQYAGSDEYERLQQIYAFVSGRIDMLNAILTAEEEDNVALRKELDRIEKSGDQEEWNELATELFEEADYKQNTDEFTQFVDGEGEELRKDIKGLIADWRNCVDEGRIEELGMLLEAIAEDEAEGDDDLDLALDPEGGADFGPREHRGSCATSDDDADCCSVEEFEADGCCGSKDPCCRSKGDA
jgi:hypothetical protein